MLHIVRRAREIRLRFQSDESGATAMEYALLAVLVAVPLIASVTVLGGSLATKFLELAGAF